MIAKRLPTMINPANTSETTVKLCPFPNSWRRSSKISCSVSRKALKNQMKVKGYIPALISQDRIINKVISLQKRFISIPVKMSPESNFFSSEHLEKYFGLQILEFTISKLKKPGVLKGCFQ